MKTTVDLPEELIIRGKKVALERKTTLKSMIENGLIREIQSPSPTKVGVIQSLRRLDSSIWNSVTADDYVKEQRTDWE